MKKSLLVFCFLMSSIGAFAQFEGSDNAFKQAETSKQQPEQSNLPPVDPGDEGPSNPEDPVPIDDYIPLLLLTALGTIVYVKRKKIKQA